MLKPNWIFADALKLADTGDYADASAVCDNMREIASDFLKEAWSADFTAMLNARCAVALIARRQRLSSYPVNGRAA